MYTSVQVFGQTVFETVNLQITIEGKNTLKVNNTEVSFDEIKCDT